MIHIKAFAFNPFAENTYVLYDETKEAVIIDPGCISQAERDTLAGFIESEGLKVVKLINTHCHIDHVLGNSFVKKTYGVELGANEIEAETTLAMAPAHAQGFGMTEYEHATPDYFINEGDRIKFGNSELNTLFVPGHAPGHLAFVSYSQKFVIGGDVLFRGSIGRVDLPGGDINALLDSIKTKIFSLGNDYIVYPGHGEPTDVAFEKENNPFCGARAIR
ncbi:MBL fold hydrolase [Fulvitalea axinellae]|uniref:MBL fold hydrolase n=1 Tax=Fulvitalea axinellae TaxID=1182444 RepID=A0AAU9CIR3_9BACT|nr:MBL fold hydrolase [Fulvitalea axinellae]